jgi:hypothetical protein
MMIKSVTCGLFVAAGMLMAQTPQPAPRKVAAYTMTSGLPFAQPAVTGSPYSAEQIYEHTQTLADGTHITQPPNKTLLFRDSQGRTRTERQMMAGFGQPGPTTVTIDDPVAGCRYTLDTQNHVAHRQETQPMGSKTGMAKAWGSFGSFLAAAPNPLPPPPPPSGTGQAVVSPGIVFTGPATGPTQVQLPKPVTESLGTQILEGVEVEGRRTTFTVPEGAQGNDRPITSTNEIWMSPKLKTAVLTKSVDPRSGENTIKLTNIVLGEPDPALFQPPADFEVVDDKGPVTVRYQSPQ